MCVSCVSQVEVVVAEVAVVVAVLRKPIRRFLSGLGLVDAPLAVAGDAQTAAFLRSLDLDAAEVLGADVVESADAWVAAGQPRPERVPSLVSASRIPFGSRAGVAAH